MKKILRRIAEELADSPVETIESLMLSFTGFCVGLLAIIAVIIEIVYRLACR